MSASTPASIPPAERDPLLARLANISEEDAWGGSRGAGVRVGIVDSGIEEGHAAIEGAVAGGIQVIMGPDGPVIEQVSSVRDDFGHGTACAGIIHRIAPEAKLYSIKVLGEYLSGKGEAFLAGLRWAIDNGMDVVNLSLGTTNRRFAEGFYELVDRAYWAGCLLVAAANNVEPPSIPSIFSSLIAVGGRAFDDPLKFTFHASRLIELDAHGIDVTCPWLDGTYRRVTGTSFATPHVTGLVARIRSKHPSLTPFQVKTVLCAIGRRNFEQVAHRARAGGSRAIRVRREHERAAAASAR